MMLRTLVLLLALSAPAGAQAGPVLAVTGDQGGALLGDRGLPRVAGAFAEIARKHGELVRIDAGNGLFGAQSLAHGGRLAAEVLGELAYDAVHLTWRDFRLGVGFTSECVQRMGVPALSTNLVDEKTGEPFAAPVVQVGPGARLALLGISQRPAGLDRLPHLRRQLEGVRIRPPAEALAEWLPRAEEQSEGVVLLYYGSAAGLRPLLDRFGRRLIGCIAAGMDPAAAHRLTDSRVVVIGSGEIAVIRTDAFARGADRRAIADAEPDARVQHRVEVRAREARASAAGERSAAAEAPPRAPAGPPPAEAPAEGEKEAEQPVAVKQVEAPDEPEEPRDSAAIEPRRAPLPSGEDLDRWLSSLQRPGLAAVARIEAEPPVGGVAGLALRDGRLGGGGWSIAAGPARLSLSWPRPVGVRAVHLVLDRDSGGASLRVEGLRPDGSADQLAREQLPAFEGVHRVTSTFASRSIHGLRIELRCARPVTVTEVVVEPDDDAALASGGFNIAARATGAHLLVPPVGVGAGLHAVDGLHTVPWTLRDGAACTLVFREHRVASVAEVRIWLPETGPRPAQVEMAASEDSMFSDYYLVGRFSLEDRAGEHVVRPDRPVRARYLRLRFASAAPGAGCGVTEIEVIEASGVASMFGEEPGGEGTVDEAHGVPDLDQLLGGAPARVEGEPNEDPAAAGTLPLGEWAAGSLPSLEDVDAWRFRVGHAPDEKVRFSLHMTPFLRGRLRLCDAAGELVAEARLGATGGHSLVWEPDLEPGEYVASLSPAPIHLLFVFDSSGSMRRTFATTVEALRALVEELPDGMRVALATTSRDGSRSREFSLFTPFTRDRGRVEGAIADLFREGGSSDWYTVLADVLPFLDAEVPEDALPALVFVADGNGRGRFRDMLTALGSSRARIYSIGFGDVGADLDTDTTWDGAVGLGNLAHARHGLYQEPHGVDELLAAYRRIFADLGMEARYALRIDVRPRLPGTLATVAPPGDERPTLFVLDASGTMRESAGTKTRMEAAKGILREIAAEMPERIGIGLRVYGHRYLQRRDRQRASVDTELVAAIDDPRQVLLRELERVRPKGSTPLAYTMGRIAGDLGRVERSRVILITDGVDSFREDAIGPAEELAGTRPGMELVVVGFGIGHVRDRETLRGIASAAGGCYFDARDGEQLVRVMREALHPQVPFTVVDWRGREVARGVFGDRLRLLEGRYRCRFRMDGGEVQRPFAVKAGSIVELDTSL